jgi:hypothetical protein
MVAEVSRKQVIRQIKKTLAKFSIVEFAGNTNPRYADDMNSFKR